MAEWFSRAPATSAEGPGSRQLVQQGMGARLSSFTQQGMGARLSSFTQQGMGARLSSFTQQGMGARLSSERGKVMSERSGVAPQLDGCGYKFAL